MTSSVICSGFLLGLGFSGNKPIYQATVGLRVGLPTVREVLVILSQEEYKELEKRVNEGRIGEVTVKLEVSW